MIIMKTNFLKILEVFPYVGYEIMDVMTVYVTVTLYHQFIDISALFFQLEIENTFFSFLYEKLITGNFVFQTNKSY